jgi:hypothetical protein
MKKISIIGISLSISIILFFTLIWIERRVINYEPKVKVLIALEDIEENELLKESMFKTFEVPLSLSLNADMNLNLEKIQGKFSRGKIYKGQILLKADIGEKEELRIIELPQGREKIAIKIKNPENGISYQIKPKDKVNVYFTGKYGGVRDVIGDKLLSDNTIYTFKILENEEVLGVFDEKGASINLSEFSKIDTVMFGVIPDKAKLINNLRSQGVFDITG